MRIDRGVQQCNEECILGLRHRFGGLGATNDLQQCFELDEEATFRRSLLVDRAVCILRGEATGDGK